MRLNDTWNDCVRAQQHDWIWASDSGLQSTRAPPECFTAIVDAPVALQRVCPIKDYLPALINMPSELEQGPGRDGRGRVGACTLFSVNQESAGRGQRGGCGCSRALTDNFPLPFFDPQQSFIIRAFWSLFAKQGRVTGNEKRQLLFRIQLQFLVLK